MPLIRKLSKVGNSFAIFLPSDWSPLKDKRTQIREVEIEVNDCLIVRPRIKG